MTRALRFLLSGVSTTVIMVAMSFAIADPAQAHGTRITGIIVGGVIAAISIYDIDRWSLVKRSVAHAAVMVAIVVPCLIFSGWFDLGTGVGVLAMLGTFAAFGVAGWGIGFLLTSLLTKRAASEPSTPA